MKKEEVKKIAKEYPLIIDCVPKEIGVALCPGPFFGNYGERYVRLCYANPAENIEIGIERMKYVLKNR